MKGIKLFGIAAGIILSAAMLLSAADAGELGAKSLFYDPSQKANAQDSAGKSNTAAGSQETLNPGVMYWIELVRPTGAVMRVSNDRIFRSGDQIRIHFTTNSDGHLQVVHEGSSGSIIPVPMSNKGEVKMGVDYVIPENGGTMAFDNKPGKEKLNLIFASMKSSGEVLDKMKKGQAEIVSLISQYQNSPNRLQHVERGSKDLILTSGPATSGTTSAQKYEGQVSPTSFNVNGDSNFKVDEAVYNAPGNYAVNTSVKEPVVIETILNHQQ